MRNKYLVLGLAVLSAMGGCSGLVIDPSPSAMAAGDLTSVSSCLSAPGQSFGLASGVDACRFSSGDTISSSWTIVAPPQKNAKQVTGGTVDVYMKDVHKSYPVLGWTVSVPLTDLFGTTWSSAQDLSIIEALVTLNWVDNEGINQVTSYRGIAVVIVMVSGYNSLPIDSGTSAWGTTCQVQVSTAGRSALLCK